MDERREITFQKTAIPLSSLGKTRQFNGDEGDDTLNYTSNEQISVFSVFSCVVRFPKKHRRSIFYLVICMPGSKQVKLMKRFYGVNVPQFEIIYYYLVQFSDVIFKRPI